MPFGATVMGDVFQRKLDQCFGHLQNVIVIADDIMVIGKQPNHKDHDQALNALLNTARKCNICLNHEKLQYKQQEVKFFREHILQMAISQHKARSRPYKRCWLHDVRNRYNHLLGWLTTCQKFSTRISELA